MAGTATGHRFAGLDLGLKRWLGGLTIRKERQGCLKGKTTGGAAEQTFKHRARDALGLADLRKFGLRQASMSRGVEARGSVRTLGVPRALGTFRERRLDYGVPGAAAERWLFNN